jgi:hypothetical protein
VRAALPALKAKHHLTTAALEQVGDDYDIEIVINPGKKTRKKKFDPAKLKVGDVVNGAYKDPRWLDPERVRFVPGIVTSMDPIAKTFHWKSGNLAIPREGNFNLADFDVKWKKGHESQIKIPEDILLEQNKEQKWDNIVVARVVLNYRHHQTQFNAFSTQWEHIIESSAGGDHSSENLALTAATLNNKLGKWFERPFASHEAPSGLSGTGGDNLRDYLKTVPSLYIHNRWKQHAYDYYKVSLKWNNSPRGVWRELN